MPTYRAHTSDSAGDHSFSRYRFKLQGSLAEEKERAIFVMERLPNEFCLCVSEWVKSKEVSLLGIPYHKSFLH